MSNFKITEIQNNDPLLCIECNASFIYLFIFRKKRNQWLKASLYISQFLPFGARQRETVSVVPVYGARILRKNCSHKIFIEHLSVWCTENECPPNWEFSPKLCVPKRTTPRHYSPQVESKLVKCNWIIFQFSPNKFRFPSWLPGETE